MTETVQQLGCGGASVSLRINRVGTEGLFEKAEKNWKTVRQKIVFQTEGVRDRKNLLCIHLMILENSNPECRTDPSFNSYRLAGYASSDLDTVVNLSERLYKEGVEAGRLAMEEYNEFVERMPVTGEMLSDYFSRLFRMIILFQLPVFRVCSDFCQEKMKQARRVSTGPVPGAMSRLCCSILVFHERFQVLTPSRMT